VEFLLYLPVVNLMLILEQIHARNFLKEAVEHALLANLKPFVKHLPNTCPLKNL